MRYALLGFCLLTACGEKVLYLGEPGRGTVRVEPPLQLLWTHKMDGSPLGSALFAGDLILQLTTTSTLYALDRRNGAQLGKHGYDKMACAPGQLAGELYALGVLGRKPSLRILDRRTATERWRHEGTFCQVPVVRGDTLVAVDDKGVVQALRLADGHLLWRAELGGLARTGAGAERRSRGCRHGVWGLGGPERGKRQGALAHELGRSRALAARTRW